MITQLSPLATSGRVYNFLAKTEAPVVVDKGILTTLSPSALSGARYSFFAKTAVVIPTEYNNLIRLHFDIYSYLDTKLSLILLDIDL